MYFVLLNSLLVKKNRVPANALLNISNTICINLPVVLSFLRLLFPRKARALSGQYVLNSHFDALVEEVLIVSNV